MSQNSVEPRQRLIDAAISVFGECGFRGATTRRIADAAGVNEVTIFRLFGSKSALLEEAVRQSEGRAIHPTHAELPETPGLPEAELETWARDHWRAMRERRSVIRKMMSEVEEHPELSACMTEGWDRMRSNMTRYVEKLRDRGDIDADVPVSTAVAMFSGTLFADAMGRDIKRNAYPPERQAITEYTKLFLRALGYVPARATNVVPR